MHKGPIFFFRQYWGFELRALCLKCSSFSTSCPTLVIFWGFLFVCGIGVWIQGLLPPGQALPLDLLHQPSGFFIIAILIDIKCYFNVVFMCIFVITHVKYICMFLSAIIFLRVVFSGVLQFSNLTVFLLSYRSSLHILDSNLLSDMWFSDIFSHPVGCLFILITSFSYYYCY
jgi:hypothetical protein